MNLSRGIRWAVPAAVILSALIAGTVMGHQAKSITASAVCGGATTVTVKADVWGGIHLIVKVDNVVIHDAAENGNDQSVRTFVYSTSTTPGGHVASARTSDQNGSVSTEFNTPQPCPTPTPTRSPLPTPTATPRPTPSPTPSPSSTPTPTPTPTATPRVTPSSTPIPTVTPNLTLPPTTTPSDEVPADQSPYTPVLFLLSAIGTIAYLLIWKFKRPYGTRR